MVGNTIITSDGKKYRILDKIRCWEAINKPRNAMEYEIVHIDKYLCIDQEKVVIRINPKHIKQIL